jgi:hypothetical protein
VPDATPVTVLVNGESRVYFRVTAERPLVLPVAGPARVRVVTRLELPTATDHPVPYTLRFATGAHVLKEYKTESSTGTQARLASGTAALGKSRRATVNVPHGENRLTLAVGDSSTRVLVRIERAAPGKQRDSMVSLTPVSAPRSVTVLEGEKSVAYYSALPGKPVQLRVVGPTTLELLSRLDFDSTMHGTQAYRFAVREGEKVIRTVETKTTKATTASYSEVKECVPSKCDHTRISLDEGLHEITLDLIAPRQGAIEFHARLPQTTLGNKQ